MLPLVSIIITTKNEERNISNCLNSILYQSYPKDRMEIIVVDNNSLDQTQEIALRYTNKVYNIVNYISSQNIKNHRGAQINFGVKKSKGEIIFFPDTDMTFDRDLIKEATQKLKQLNALYVPEIIYSSKGLLGKIRNFERSFYNGTCIDAVRIVKKKLYPKTGGFDEKNIMFGPDDWDFTKRLKQLTDKIGIMKAKIYHHEEQLSVRAYLSKKRRYAHTFYSYAQKWGLNDRDIKMQLGFSYRYFSVFWEEGKWRRLIKHPIVASGMYLLKFLIGLDYFIHKK